MKVRAFVPMLFPVGVTLLCILELNAPIPFVEGHPPILLALVLAMLLALAALARYLQLRREFSLAFPWGSYALFLSLLLALYLPLADMRAGQRANARAPVTLPLTMESGLVVRRLTESEVAIVQRDGGGFGRLKLPRTTANLHIHFFDGFFVLNDATYIAVFNYDGVRLDDHAVFRLHRVVLPLLLVLLPAFSILAERWCKPQDKHLLLRGSQWLVAVCSLLVIALLFVNL